MLTVVPTDDVPEELTVELCIPVLIVVAFVSIPIISSDGNKAFKHALEWNYFVGVILFYCLTRFLWRRTT